MQINIDLASNRAYIPLNGPASAGRGNTQKTRLIGGVGEMNMYNGLHIALIQDNPTVGDVTANVERAITHLHKNKEEDLIVFSEMFVTGYPLGDLVLRPGFMAIAAAGIEKIKNAVVDLQGPAVLIGAPMAGAELPYNAAFLIEPSGAVRVVRKTELPNDDVFDERRTFASEGAKPRALPFRGYRLGIQICEDVWHGPVSRALADDRADILLVLNGSPYQRGKQDTRHHIARARIRATGLPMAYVNQVGGQDELVFDGGSFIMNPDGGFSEAAAFVPDEMHIVLHRDEAGDPHLRFASGFVARSYPQDPVASDYEACVLGLRDYVKKTGMPRVFVGVSGGLDSALVLAMAVDAIGSDRVVGVMMPSAHTGQESLDLADDLMTRLGVHKHEIRIDTVIDGLDPALTAAGEALATQLGVKADHSVARENYQSRLRAVALMGLTNQLGGIVLSTGNKSEMSVGYATLYGDMCGGFNPLKSVYKTTAFEMCRWRNAVSELAGQAKIIRDPIPKKIITRPPTAELSEGQTDQASLGDYDLLDHVLESIVEGRADPKTAAARLLAKFGDKDVFKRSGGYAALSYAEKIARLVRIAQYKRDQSPPGVKLNQTDYGLGWRYPIAGKYAL